MPRPRSAADLREHVAAAHSAAARALDRLQAKPTPAARAEFEWATQFELDKRAELDAAIAREARS